MMIILSATFRIRFLNLNCILDKKLVYKSLGQSHRQETRKKYYRKLLIIVLQIKFLERFPG